MTKPFDPEKVDKPKFATMDDLRDAQLTPEQKIEADRAKIYGDPFLSHQAIGLAWEGVFRNRYHFISEWLNKEYPELLGRLFPADLVAEMLVAFKSVRLARPTYHDDSRIDLKVYADFSGRFRNNK